MTVWYYWNSHGDKIYFEDEAQATKAYESSVSRWKEMWDECVFYKPWPPHSTTFENVAQLVDYLNDE